MNTDQRAKRSEILRILDDYHAAMVDARIDILEDMLNKEYALEHITGYVQPKAEWLELVRSGDFDYHTIQLDKQSLTADFVTSNSAVLKGRGIFNATINGMKNHWKLQFTVELAQQKGQWRLTHAKYLSY
ncbi:MAG: nuclear transport factor 2 family protein [Burkholderiaceae bacterium]